MVDIRVGQTVVPTLIGLDQGMAEAALDEADLFVAYAPSQYSSDYDAGVVMAIDATEGADIDPGSTITLTVSLGEEPVSAGTATGSGVIPGSHVRFFMFKRKKHRRPSIPLRR